MTAPPHICGGPPFPDTSRTTWYPSATPAVPLTTVNLNYAATSPTTTSSRKQPMFANAQSRLCPTTSPVFIGFAKAPPPQQNLRHTSSESKLIINDSTATSHGTTTSQDRKTPWPTTARGFGISQTHNCLLISTQPTPRPNLGKYATSRRS